MFDYKFVEVQVVSFSGKPKLDYKAIITEHALEGCRLHTFQPLPFSAGGQALQIQLIFEKVLK